MCKYRTKLILFMIILITSTIINLTYAQSGEITGKVVDGLDNSPLTGANIIVKGTTNGTVTDIDGKFRIVNIHEGSNTILFRYLGYQTDSVIIKVVPGKVNKINIKLIPYAVNINEVVVTGQRQGQQAAINEQLNSNSIVNIVSKDKIMELPDQNAAETLARLPGISLQRDGGEGQKVVIRGLAPKYSNITVNGQKIPSTDADDRSVDLSSISPDMLAGIEVFKSLTPDKDGDVVGGTVNFTVKKAPENFHGDFKIQNGYGSQQDYYGNYRSSLNLSDRFFDNMLGVVATANIQKADRSSDAQDVTYAFDHQGPTEAVLKVDNLNLADVQETRKRYGASLTADYDLGSGTIIATGFYSKTDQDELRRRKRYQISNYRTQYELRYGESTTQIKSGSLQGNYDYGIFQVDGQLAFSESDENTPQEINDIFQELSSINSNIVLTQGPDVIPSGFKNNLNNTTFKESDINSYNLLNINKTAELNFKANFEFGKDISGYLKFGGKFRGSQRARNDQQYWTSSFNIDSIGMEQFKNINSYYRQFNLSASNKILMSNFLSGNDQVGKFLNGEYNFGPSLDLNSLNQFMLNSRNAKLYNGTQLFVYNPIFALQNYTASEDISSGYIMAEVNISSNLLFVPGVRVENTYSDYKSIIGTPSSDDEIPDVVGAKDTTGSRTYYDILPMFQLKYKITDWFDIRAAATRTLSRPDYFNLVPWQQIDVGNHLINKGNPILKHTRVVNYDLFASIYNEYGLFTVGGFYKKLWDVDYIESSRILGGQYNGYTITQPVNAGSPSTVYGIEIDAEANMTLLPSPFDGIVFSGNLSIMKSTTYYPLLNVTVNPTPPPYQLFTTTEREGNMPGQANYVGNLAIGYEKGGFTGRLSIIFQGKSLFIVGQSEEFDSYTDASIRWDLTMQQKVFYNFSLYANVNNLTNIPDKAFQGIDRLSTSIVYYGWTADLGVKFKF